MKKLKTGLLVGALALLLTLALSGCGSLGRYTIQIRTWDELLAIYTVQYRESGTTEWSDANMFDEDGGSVLSIVRGDSSRSDTAYFDVPGAGTYDFRALSILGNEVGMGIIEDCEVTEPNGGDLYYYTLSIGDDTLFHYFE